jgi:putative endonuclease
MTHNSWYVYLIKSFKDGSIYTGISTDYKRRIQEHNRNKGAKYTRGRGPWYLMAVYAVSTKSEALKKEASIKKLNKEQKIKFCLNSLQHKGIDTPFKDSYWYATNFGPDVISVKMSMYSYNDIQKYGRGILNLMINKYAFKTGLVASIYGIEIHIARMPTNLTCVTYKNGEVRTLCDFHGWNNSQKCDHIDYIAREIHDS